MLNNNGQFLSYEILAIFQQRLDLILRKNPKKKKKIFDIFSFALTDIIILKKIKVFLIK